MPIRARRSDDNEPSINDGGMNEFVIDCDELITLRVERIFSSPGTQSQDATKITARVSVDEPHIYVAYTHLATLSVISEQLQAALAINLPPAADLSKREAPKRAPSDSPELTRPQAEFDVSQITQLAHEAFGLDMLDRSSFKKHRHAATSRSSTQPPRSLACAGLVLPQEVLCISLEIECATGVWLHILDDADGIGLPMFEVAIRSLDATFESKMYEGLETPPHAVASLSLCLSALNFNSVNTRWEPVLEESKVAVQLHLQNSALGVHVTAYEPIELNVSHGGLS